MKGIFYVALACMAIFTTAFAVDPLILSEPNPAISPVYSVHTSNTAIYSLTNNVPKNLPLSITGLSTGITRSPVVNDCGNSIPAGPSLCNIGITISPTDSQIGTSLSQLLEVNYQGRTALTSPISFSVIEPIAYVTPSAGASTLQEFVLDASTGLVTSNTTAYTNGTQHYGKLTFATIGGAQYAYVVDQAGYVYQCTINVDGTFNTCAATPQSPPSGWAPYDIAFATVNGVQYAYVVEVDAGNVYQCALNPDGSFNDCSLAIPTGFNAPYGIDFATIDGVQYAYLAESVSSSSSYGTVYQCTLNIDGSFIACTPLTGSATWIPYAIAFTTVAGTQYAYVADNGTTLTNGQIYQCNLKGDGTFNGCTATPSPAPVGHWAPSDLAFTTLDGTQYAYVTNYQGPTLGGMYKCTLRMLDAGALSGCVLTPFPFPSYAWQPVGVAFRL